MFALATVDFVTGVSTVTFADIPQDYTHLQLRYGLALSVPGNGDSNINLTFNSDSTSGNYRNHRLLGDGASATATASAGESRITLPVRATSSTDYINSVGIIDILDYKSTTKVKTVKVLFGFDTNNTKGGVVSLNSAIYSPGLNTTPAPTAITTISFVVSTYGFANNGIIALYGIKSA
jgi:hypothetical protein